MHNAMCRNCSEGFHEQVSQGSISLAKEYLLGQVLQYNLQARVWDLERHLSAL
jgi:hypothetical protein